MLVAGVELALPAKPPIQLLVVGDSGKLKLDLATVSPGRAASKKFVSGPLQLLQYNSSRSSCCCSTLFAVIYSKKQAS